MESILFLTDKLIHLLEQSKRIKDIFLVSERDKKDYARIIGDYSISFDFFNSLYEVLTSIISYEYIEIVQNTEGEAIFNDIVEDSRLLAHKLSLFERDNRANYLQDLNSRSIAWKFVYLRSLLILFFCSSSFEYEYSEEKLAIAQKYSVGQNYYRGHSNSSFHIIPSMIRSLGKSQIIDYKKIITMYENSGLLEKYKSHINSSAIVNYDFCSFIQHATSYSPLIDFTKNKDIALSFATYPNGNLNVYNSTDASLILLSLKDPSETIDISKISLDYHASKLKLDSEIYGIPLYKCSLNEFNTSFGLSTFATNDRMKYQQGVFFCFYHCVIVKGIPLIPWSKGFLATFRIKCASNPRLGIKSKKDIYNEIIHIKPEYDFDHLMNPYRYFGEYNK